MAAVKAVHRLPLRRCDSKVARRVVGLFDPDDVLVGTYTSEQDALTAAWAAQPAAVRSRFRGLSTRAVRYLAKRGWRTLTGVFVDRGTWTVATWKLVT